MNPAMSTSAIAAAPDDRLLALMQLRADPLADQTIQAIVGTWPAAAPSLDPAQWERINTVNRLLNEWSDNATLLHWQAQGTGVDASMAEALQAYVHSAQVLPAWAEPAKIERAEQLFMRHGALSCILLFCASLPECYVIPDLSSVLHTSGQLEQNAEYRIRSTAAMIFPVMLHGGMGAKGAGIAQVLKVRLIHATIRNLILHGSPQAAVEALDAGGTGRIEAQAQPSTQGREAMLHTLTARGWDVRADGLPCNQEELAYTLLTFGYVFLRSMRRLGLALSQTDEQAYLHAWNVVGHVLGIERSMMADTMEQAESLMERMQARGRAQPVLPDPRPALGRALMQTMQDALPWRCAKAFPQLMTRHLCGAQTARDIGLTDPVGWTSVALFWGLLGLAKWIDRVVRWIIPPFSLVRALVRVLGYHFMSHVLMSQTRPLQLPTVLLNQVDDVVHSWSDDPQAPAWLNWLEDRLTVKGSWRLSLARPAVASAVGGARS